MNIKEELARMELDELLECVAELEQYKYDVGKIDGKIRDLNRKCFGDDPYAILVIDKMVYREMANRYAEVLRNVDNHIRSTPEPVPYIIEELKAALPEYKI